MRLALLPELKGWQFGTLASGRFNRLLAHFTSQLEADWVPRGGRRGKTALTKCAATKALSCDSPNGLAYCGLIGFCRSHHPVTRHSINAHARWLWCLIKVLLPIWLYLMCNLKLNLLTELSTSTWFCQLSNRWVQSGGYLAHRTVCNRYTSDL